MSRKYCYLHSIFFHAEYSLLLHIEHAHTNVLVL